MEVTYLDMSAVLRHIETLSKVELLAVCPATFRLRLRFSVCSSAVS